jgi:hypothetical protein
MKAINEFLEIALRVVVYGVVMFVLLEVASMVGRR